MMQREITTVSNTDAIDDSVWFDQHPGRRYRARQGDRLTWLVRKKGGVFLRAWVRRSLKSIDDSAAALGPKWFETAFPNLLADKAQRLARKAGVRR